MDGFTLRPYIRTDLEACYALDQVCFPAGIAYSRSDLRTYLSRANAFVRIAESAGQQGNQLAGFLIAATAGRSAAHIVTLNVAPSVRRLGVATALMEAAEKHYRKMLCQTLTLEVAVDNQPALAFYRKHGFVLGKRIRGYYDGHLDAVVMTKAL